MIPRILSFGTLLLAAVTVTQAQDNLTVSSRTYGNGQTETLFASVKIETSGTVTLQNGSDVSYQAGEKVSLQPGFTASEGTRFRAFVPPPPPVAAALPGTAVAATPALSARYDSQSGVPLTLAPGATTSVTLQMQNTGTTTWAAGSTFKLGSNGESSTWGLTRVVVGSATATGSVATFTFTITAPTTTGAYSFRWRMLQEGTAWFGDLTPDWSIVVVTNPTGDNNGNTISNADEVRLGLDPSGNHSTDTDNSHVILNIHKP